MGLLYRTETENQYPGGADPNGNGGGNELPPSPVTPPPPVTGPTIAQASTGGPGGGGHGQAVGPDLSFPNLKFGPVPKFSAPGYVPLDAASVLKDPGYQFRVQQGEEGLQRSAAAKGLLRSGGTLKDLVQYDQNFASNEYNNAEDRHRAAYGLNYQLAKDEYAPLLAEWNTMSAGQLQKALAIYNRGTIWNAPYHGGGGMSYPEQILGPGEFGL